MDVIIVGGGVSALVAAVELARAGRRVSMYEKQSRDWLGGQCIDAFGGIFFVDSPEQRRLGIHDSFELAWQDWQGYAEFGPDSQRQQAWARRYIERSVPDVREWLVRRGLSFLPVANWAERARDGRGNRLPRFHLLWGCGPALVSALVREAQSFEGRSLTIHDGHRVQDLLLEAGRVTGVRGNNADGQFEARAEHVVIAAGGRTGDLAKVRASWPRDDWRTPPEDLLGGVWPHIDGHLQDVVADAGGSVVHLENMWVYAAGVAHWDGDFPEHGLALIPPKSGLWMRADGSRFDPPQLAGYDTREAVSRVMATGRPWSWMVLNREILAKEGAIQGARFNPAFREQRRLRVVRDLIRGNDDLAGELINHCPDVVTAPDLTTLAAHMTALTPGTPIDAAALSRDVAAYDAEIARGRRLFSDPQLVALRNVRAFLGDRLRTSAFVPIAAGDHGELVAIRLRPVARKTLGGIETDEHCRVVRSDGSVLPGLYAIGEAAGFGGGGMHGKRTLEGTLLGGCVLTGRELARSVAALG